MTPKAAHVTQLRLMALDPVHIKKRLNGPGKEALPTFSEA